MVDAEGGEGGEPVECEVGRVVQTGGGGTMPAPAGTPAEDRQYSTSFGPSHPSSYFSIEQVIHIEISKIESKPN